MNTNKDPLYSDPELKQLMQRYKESLRSKQSLFFDVHEFDSIIEYFLQDGDLVNAEKALQMAKYQHPDTSLLQVREAHFLVDKGGYEQALDLISRIEYAEFGNTDLHLLKGIALNFLGNMNEARDSFKKAIEYAGDNYHEILYNIAVNFENLDDYNTAIEFLLDAYKFDKRNLAILYELAFCYEKTNSLESAIEYYNLYLDIDPFSDNVWFNLGIVHIRLQEYENALEAFDFSLVLNEDYPLAHYNKANTLSSMARYEEAIQEYKEHLLYEPGNADTHSYIGECYERMGDIESAILHYHQALSHEPNCSDALFGIGIICSLKEEFNDSLVFIKKAIDINPNISEYWFSLGNIYLKIKDDEKALSSYQKAIELDPYDYESWLNIAEVYYNKNLLSKALRVLIESLSYNADIALVNYRLAAYYFLRGDKSDGMNYLKNGLHINQSEHKELLRLYPEAIHIKEINDIIRTLSHIKS